MLKDVECLYTSSRQCGVRTPRVVFDRLARGVFLGTVLLAISSCGQQVQSLSSGLVRKDDPITINKGLTITSDRNVSLTLSSRTAVSMYITNSSGCSQGGEWKPYQEQVPWQLGAENQETTVYVKFRTQQNKDSDCFGAKITHDNIAPTLSLTKPAEGVTVNAQNQTSFELAGECAADTVSITMTLGSLNKELSCTQKQWSATYDLSALPDGNINLKMTAVDRAGNVSLPLERTLIKDTQIAGTNTITIAAGAAITSSQTVALTLSAPDAAEMYITNVDGCASGGSWESFAATKSWGLAQQNATASVYARFRDASGNLSSCVSDSIRHDSIAPTLASLAITSPSPTSSVSVTLASGALSEEISSYCLLENSTTVTGCTWVNGAALPTTYSLSSSLGSKVLTAWVKDAAGLVSAPVSSNAVSLISPAPSLASLAVSNSSPTRLQSYSLNWGAASGTAFNSSFQHIGILSLEFHVDKLSRPLL